MEKEIVFIDPERIFDLQKKYSEKAYLYFKNRNLNFSVAQVFKDHSKSHEFQIWLWEPGQTKVIPINSFIKDTKEYVLLKGLWDKEIQAHNNSIPISEDQFWEILYLLIIDPELGERNLKYKLQTDKTYIFHVRLSNFVSNSVIRVTIFWDGDWCMSAGILNCGMSYREGNIFIFF